jgi:DNA-binding GntR family transcriptional regulator
MREAMAERPVLQSLERESLRGRVYGELRGALLGGRFASGERLTIRALAQALGTSPTPVREALMRLQAERALDLQANGSALIPVMTRGRFEQVTTIRLALEGAAAGLAASRATSDDLDDLSSILQQMVALVERTELDGYLELHRDFHFRIYRCSGNPLLVGMIEGLWMQCGPVLTYVLPEYVLRRSGSRQHQMMVEALRQRDSDGAREALVQDISGAAEYLQTLADGTGVIRPP